MTDTTKRECDLGIAKACLGFGPDDEPQAIFKAHVEAIADALAEREREVWQRVVELAAEQDIDVAAFVATAGEPSSLRDPLKAAALAILRAASSGAKP